MNSAIRNFLIANGADKALRAKQPMLEYLDKAVAVFEGTDIAEDVINVVVLSLAIRTEKFRKGLRLSREALSAVAPSNTVNAVLTYSALQRTDEKFDVNADSWPLTNNSVFNTASNRFTRAVIVLNFAVVSILRGSPSNRAINLASRLGFNLSNPQVQALPGTPVGIDRIPSVADLVGILGEAFNEALAVPFEYEGNQIILSLPSAISLGMSNPVLHVMGDFGPEIAQIDKTAAGKARKAVNDRLRHFVQQYNQQLAALSSMSEGQRRVWRPVFDGE